MKLKINKNNLLNFCKKNNFIIISNKMLKKENIKKNLVYSTKNNFTGKIIYPRRVSLIMNKDVWAKLIKINNELKEKGKCITLYDSYRPIQIQKLFWDIFFQIFGFHDETLVANPNKYGTHNIKINAVDILISNIDNTPIDFDDFTEKASIYYKDCSSAAIANRDLLITTAEKYGLIVNKSEWWHYIDERIAQNGIEFNYSNSDLIPEDEEKTFILK